MLEGDGKLNTPIPNSVWEKKFVSSLSWRIHDSIKMKHVLPQLLERLLNLDAEKNACVNIYSDRDRGNRMVTLFPRTKGQIKANLTLVKELYAN